MPFTEIKTNLIANSAVTQTKIDPAVELGGGLDVIVDKFTGNGTTTQYTITETPTDEDKTIVIIEGVVQLKNSYSVSGNVVTFSSAIPNNYNFEIISFAGSNGGGGGSGPKITTVEVTNSGGTVIDDTAVDIAGGYIKITGTGFVTGCQVIVNNIAATSTTFVSSTVVRAQLPATAAGTYFVYVVNPDGGVAIKINGVTFSGIPTWVTGSALTAINGAAYSLQLNATGASTYSLQAGSTLPSGLTLSSGGLLSGTVSGLSQNTVYSFTIVASDAENQDAARTFDMSVSVNRVLSISPAVSGISTWTLETDGAINLSTSGEWTIIPTNSFTINAKLWGAGGGGLTSPAGQPGGGGGYATGIISLIAGTTYKLRVGGGGGGLGTTGGGIAGYNGGGAGANTGTYGGGGGGASGLYITDATIQNNAILIAGGGGGGGYNDGGTQGPGGAGGGSSGIAGGSGSGGTGVSGGGAGTQVSGGTGGDGNNASGATDGTNGSALTGGAGGARGSSGAGGGGGGGGYFGGGGGGGQGTINTAGGGGGGGSGYAHPSLVTSSTLTAGSGTTPGNSGDALRGTSGNGGSATAGIAGRIYFT